VGEMPLFLKEVHKYWKLKYLFIYLFIYWVNDSFTLSTKSTKLEAKMNMIIENNYTLAISS